MEKITLLIWVIGILLIVFGITSVFAAILTHTTTKKADYFWTEKNMAKRLRNRNFKMKIIRWFRNKKG